jgi:hypothetical protein
MSVAFLQRSISGDCNAHKHAGRSSFRIVIAAFDQTTVVYTVAKFFGSSLKS